MFTFLVRFEDIPLASILSNLGKNVNDVRMLLYFIYFLVCIEVINEMKWNDNSRYSYRKTGYNLTVNNRVHSLFTHPRARGNANDTIIPGLFLHMSRYERPIRHQAVPMNVYRVTVAFDPFTRFAFPRVTALEISGNFVTFTPFFYRKPRFFISAWSCDETLEKEPKSCSTVA